METPRNDPVIAEVRAVRDEYAARHGHDVAAIFRDIRALQEASGRAIRHVEPLIEAVIPAAKQLSEVFRQLEPTLGPFLQRLKEWSDSIDPHLVGESLQAFREWKAVDALNEVGWLPYHSAPFHYVEECGDDLALLDSLFSDYLPHPVE